MSALVEVLYPAPDVRRTPVSLLGWWERRRPLYNAVVGATGAFTLTVLTAVAALLPGVGAPDPRAVLPMVLAYAIAANGCYTLGWMLEMAARAAWGDRAPHVGPLLFREGLIFSVGLTLLPVLMTGPMVVLRLLGLLGLIGP